MDLDELRAVQSKERQTDSPQHLRPSFYQEVADYIQSRKDERNAVAAETDDPFSSPEVGRLTDEIETAKDVVEAIYERRMGKLVKQASLAAAGMPADDEGLTAEEADLFGDLVARIESNKGRVLEVLEGQATSSVESGAQATTETETETVSEERGPGPEPNQSSTGAPEPKASDPTPADEPPMPPSATDGGEGVSVADAMGGGPSSTTAEPTPPPADADSPTTVEDGPNPVSEHETESKPDPNAEHEPKPKPDPNAKHETESDTETNPVDRMTLRITQDIGDILGVDDREYTLAADDIVTLPEQNATPLVKRDAAEPLE